MKFKTNSYLQVFVSLHVGAELQIPLQDSRTKPAFVVLVNHNLKKKNLISGTQDSQMEVTGSIVINLR